MSGVEGVKIEVARTILTDTSPEGMVAAIEAINREGWSELGASPRFEVHDRPDGLWFASGLPMPPFNGVVAARLTEDSADEVIDEAIEYFGSRSLPFAWSVGPLSTPSDLSERLVAQGFKAQEAQAGMAIGLDTLSDAVGVPDGLEIEKVYGDGLLGDYSDLVAMGFHVPKDKGAEFMSIIAEVTAGPDRTSWGYLGRLDGKPVATSGVIATGGGALVINVVTLEAARGRGIGAAMTHRPLADVKALGYKIGTLEATAMGYPVYVRLGMREYCRMQEYVWTPDEA